MKYQYFALLILVFFIKKSCLATQISGKVHDNISEIRCYKPFGNFRNREISSEIKLNNGSFSINFENSTPVFITLNISNEPIWLLIEPGDSLYLDVYPEKIKLNTHEWFNIQGNNREGHLYYNRVFNYYPSKKFLKVNEVLLNQNNDSDKELFEDILEIIASETQWLSNQYLNNQISKAFFDYLYYDIKLSILGEAIRTIESIEEKDNKFFILKWNILKHIDINNDKIFSGLSGFPFLLYHCQNNYMNSTENIYGFSSELSPYAHVPNVFKSFFLGICIKTIFEMSGKSTGILDDINVYLKVFPEGEFVDYFKNEIKQIKNGRNTEIVDVSFDDFFSLINTNIGQKLYIDLWATWCVPCRMEFKMYSDSAFLGTIKEFDIKNIFISIDENKDNWVSFLKSANLGGQHYIANEKLLNSIKEIFFENKEFSIPHYILINEKGQVVASDAPRPSDPKIRQLFNELLKK